MSLLKEFREFAVKGNVIDLAVGVIIGAAFGKIVSSIVEDLVMPPIGVLLGKVKFTDLFFVVPGQDKPAPAQHTLEAYKAAGISTINYGQFVSNVLQFLIVAFIVFLMVKAINKAKNHVQPPAPPSDPTTKQCPYCLSDVPIKATKCKFCTSELTATA